MNSGQQSKANLNTSVQRDAEDCYFVILLNSSFFKYLPFHISLYPHVFLHSILVYQDPL